MTAQEYLKEHAISEDSITKFGITFDENYLNIPVYNEEGEFLFNKSRNLNYIPKELRTPEQNTPEFTQKYKNESGSHATLFNYHNVKEAKAIVICEGEMDCICLNQNGIPAVTSTSGSGTFDKSWISLLENKPLYICYDNDEAGKKGIRNLITLFPNAKIIEIPDGKDVCDFFSKGYTRDDFVNITRIALTPTEWNASNRPTEHNVISAKELVSREYPGQPWLIKNILYSEGFCFIYGSEGTGKSLIALSIAKALAEGKDWLGKFKTSGKYNILILDKENPHSMMKKRMMGMDIANDNIYFLEFPEKFSLSDGKGNASEFAKDVAAIVKEKEIHCIIIDSFVDFVVGNESSSVDTQDFFNSIRELYPRIAYLGLHHENKPSQGVFRNDSQRLRGSSNINAQLFTAFRLEPVAKSKTEITLKQVKARDSQKLDKFMVRMVVKTLLDGDTIVTGFEYCGEVEESVDESKMGEVESMVMDMLSSSTYISKKQIVEVGEGKGISEKTIQRTIKGLVDAGSLNEVKKGKEKWYTIGMYAKNNLEEEDELDANAIFDGSVPGLD